MKLRTLAACLAMVGALVLVAWWTHIHPPHPGIAHGAGGPSIDPLELPANPTAGEEWDSALAPAQAGNPLESTDRLREGEHRHRLDVAWPQAAAVCWARLGRFDSTLAALERCLASAPLSPQAAELRRSARLQYGFSLSAKGEPWRGRQLGEAVLQEFPDDTDARLLLGYAQALQGATGIADDLLKTLVKEHPGSIQAWQILAQCALQRGELTEAEKRVSELEQRDPGSVSTKALRMKVDALKNRKPGSSNEHLLVICEGDCPPDIESSVLEAAQTAWDDLRIHIGYSPPFQVTILIGGNSMAPHWAAASFDGQVHLPLEAALDAGQRGSMLRHELTHAFLAQAAGGRVPLWLNEGLAQYFQGERIKNLPGSATAGWLDSLGTRRTFVDLEESQAELAYHYSLAVAQELMELHNTTALEAYLARLREGIEEREAFQKSFGDDYAHLSERIRKRL